MSTIRCKAINCGFNESGFCANPTVIIDENAMCGHVYKRGVVRLDWNQKVGKEFKNTYKFDEGDYRMILDVVEPSNSGET